MHPMPPWMVRSSCSQSLSCIETLMKLVLVDFGFIGIDDIAKHGIQGQLCVWFFFLVSS